MKNVGCEYIFTDIASGTASQWTELTHCLDSLRAVQSTKPITRFAPMWGNNQNLNLVAHLPEKDIVRESNDATATNIRREFYLIALRSMTNFRHGRIKSDKIPYTKPRSLGFVISYMLKVFGSRCRVEEIAHLRSARASSRTSSAGIR